MNQKATGFTALRQDEEVDDDDNGNSLSTEKTEQPKTTANAFPSAATLKLVGEDPAMEDEDDEIT